MTRGSSTFGPRGNSPLLPSSRSLFRFSVALSNEASAAALEGLGPFARAARDDLERGERGLRVVLVELGELETQKRIVDRLDERFVVGKRERLVAARLGDLAARANRLGPAAAPH